MIDLEKEREAFEKKCVIDQYTYNVNKNRYDATSISADNKTFSPLNASWWCWQKRAELAQAEINKEREQATEYYVDCEQLKAEINDLKQQIKELHASRESLLEYKGKIENPDYVLVPRNPTREMINSVPLIKMSDTFHGELEIFLFDEDIMKIHKAMIEAVEKGDSKHETKLL